MAWLTNYRNSDPAKFSPHYYIAPERCRIERCGDTGPSKRHFVLLCNNIIYRIDVIKTNLNNKIIFAVGPHYGDYKFRCSPGE